MVVGNPNNSPQAFFVTRIFETQVKEDVAQSLKSFVEMTNASAWHWLKFWMDSLAK